VKKLFCIGAACFAFVSLPAMARHHATSPDSGSSGTSYSYFLTAKYLEEAQELVSYALDFMGVRYQLGGRSPETGFDCSGLVGYVFQEVTGRILPRETSGLSHVGRKISRPNLRPGDLVFFNTRHRRFSHVGIYIGDHHFVHAPRAGEAVKIGDMTKGYWKKRYNGARRILPR
jgi:cell wall-associated NlpC family hydrolase